MNQRNLWMLVASLGIATLAGSFVFLSVQSPPASEITTTTQNTQNTQIPIAKNQNTPTPSITFKKMDHDPYGIWKQQGAHFSSLDTNHVSVYASPDSPLFAVVYLPSGTPKRNLVLLPGTTGVAYAGIFDEMEAAEEMDTAVISLQWYDFATRTYADAATISQAIDAAYSALSGKLAEKSVLRGFSRGGAMSFEVAALDAAGAKRFTGIANESGGVPKDGLIEAKDPTASRDQYEATFQFFSALTEGTAPLTTFENQHFFLYCGLKDEEWGTEMCENMDRANTLVPKYGGTIDEFIRDPEGIHMGLIRDEEHYQTYLTWLRQVTE